MSFWGDFVAIPGVNGNKATATKANFSWIGDTGYNPDCAVGGVLTSGGIIGVAPPGEPPPPPRAPNNCMGFVGVRGTIRAGLPVGRLQLCTTVRTHRFPACRRPDGQPGQRVERLLRRRRRLLPAGGQLLEPGRRHPGALQQHAAAAQHNLRRQQVARGVWAVAGRARRWGFT